MVALQARNFNEAVAGLSVHVNIPSDMTLPKFQLTQKEIFSIIYGRLRCSRALNV